MKRLLAFGLVGLAIVSAPAAERVALVVGNGQYRDGNALDNPVNDARAVAASLRLAGFETVLAEELGREAMEAKLRTFAASAKGAQAALFFFAGHGVEVGGENFLLPVDASVKEEYEVKHRTLPLGQVLGALDTSGARLKMVVLDCCRDNPFGRSWKRSGGGGLAAPKGGTPVGTVLIFATDPGKTAVDGSGANSPFSAALARELAMPGRDLDAVFNKVGETVSAATNGSQRPWMNKGFYGTFVFRPAQGGGPPVEPPKALPLDTAPLEATKDDPFENSIGMKFVPIGITTGGKDVLFSVWETRRKDYEAYAKANSGADDEWKDVEYKGLPVGHEPLHPVVCVSHDDAVAFCKWLTAKERKDGAIGPADEYRLPSDAEWSYAVGIGEKEDSKATPETKDMAIRDVYPWSGGKGTSPPPKGAGNYCGQETKGKFGGMIDAYDDGYATTSPVGSFPANANGLFDLGGNVWEWCNDSYDGSSGASSARVLRGGSWLNYYGDNLLSSSRYNFNPGYRDYYNGFRVVLVVSAR